MSEKKPRGYIEYAMFLDVETSGMFMGQEDPVRNDATGESYQIVSIGIVVANANTLKPVDALYLEIKWNGESLWSKEAERVHGLTLQYLEDNGVDEEDAVCQIAELILKYWGPEGVVCLGGHNVATFDRPFLRHLLTKYGLTVRFGSKTIDTNAIGFAVFGTHNSDDLFEMVGIPTRDPANHNALDDANAALRVVQVVRSMSKALLDQDG